MSPRSAKANKLPYKEQEAIPALFLCLCDPEVYENKTGRLFCGVEFRIRNLRVMIC
jgi:hypothetical protein